MASAKFLEEALRTDVDESTVNAIVGSLQTQLVQPATSAQQHIVEQSINNQNQVNSVNSNLSSGGGDTIASNGNPINRTCDPITSNIGTAAPITTTTITATTATIVNNQQLQQGQSAHIKATINRGSIPLSSSTSGPNLMNNNNQQVVIVSSIHNNNSMNFTTVSSTMSNKNNEPVKLVYPNHQIIGTTQIQQQQQHNLQQQQLQQQSTAAALLNMTNNRVTFTSQSLPNGTINLSTLSAQQQGQVGTVGNVIQTSTVLTSAGHQGAGGGLKTTMAQQQPTQTLVIKNPASNQNIVTPMMPNVQIVNMRPGTPTQSPTQQKTVATVSPRVVLGGQHVVGTRPSSSAITLSALQNLQPGQSGPALLLKTENGQYQLLRVGPVPAPVSQSQTLTSSGNQTIRLQTVPAVSRFTGPPLALRKQTIVTQQHQVKSKANQQTMVSSTANIVVNSVTHTVSPSISTSQPTTVTVAAAPPIASVAPVPALAQQNSSTIVGGTSGGGAVGGTMVVTTSNAAPPNQGNLQNTKEKCRKFLANLLELSSREPKPVERNVRTLIQELIDANVEPEEFCDRLERLLNASPQPCLIGFLKKSLPLLRQSLVTKELVIDGIKPPPHHVAFTGTVTHIPAQVRPVVQPAIISGGQTQVRMVTQTTPRPIGQTTITRHMVPVRIQGPINSASGPRLMNASIAQVRPGIATIGGGTTIVHTTQSNPPALQPVTPPAFAPGGAQIRLPPHSQVTVSTRAAAPLHKLPTPRQSAAAAKVAAAAAAAAAAASSALTTTGQTTTSFTIAHTVAQHPPPPVKIGSTQIKPVTNVSNSYINSSISTSIIGSSTISNTINSVATNSTGSSPSGTPSNVSPITVVPPVTTAPSLPAGPTVKMITVKAQSAGLTATKQPAKEKEKKQPSVSSSAFFQPSAISSSTYGDDDINDVAAMGGVNLAEESQRILGSTELIGTQIRSCKDEVFLHMPALQNKIKTIIAKHGLDDPNSDVAVLISHATQERLKNIVEKLAVIAEHRIDIIKVDPRYEVTKDVRGQIKFLEELDKAELKRHEEQEREMLMRAAKSRSKNEDPEQAKLKAKAKEMQRAEMEELRQRDANLTALQAIGPRKKPRLDGDAATTLTAGATSSTGSVGTSNTPLRPRIKRVNLRDMLFYLEQERDTCRSPMLYKAYLK